MDTYTLNAGDTFQPLHKLIRREGIDLGMPCAGNHTCGKCRVMVEGNTSEMNAAEAAFLTEEEAAAGMRLACFARVQGDVTITIPKQRSDQILTEGVAACKPDEPMFSAGAYGAAIDIGTTTVVCYLFGRSGSPLVSVSEMNRQRRFGADVISRIQYCMEHETGLAEVHGEIVRQLEDMLLALSMKAGIGREEITAAVVTGNTIMLHLFAGLDPAGMGCLPFTPETLFDWESDTLLQGVHVYLPPCVSAYVGADLLCCVLASDMLEKEDTACVVDIGTNGEMALYSGGVLSCCSTAAGPAFEGAGIHCGMMAADGAIAHVKAADGAYRWQTIGDAAPKGICGSGVVETVEALLATGALCETGRFEEEAPGVGTLDGGAVAFTFPGTGVYFAQDDVRQLQLAKAAIYGGMETLLSGGGIGFDDLDVLYVCGGFGSYLDLQAAEAIGLIPPASAGKTVVLGNGAAAGAARALMSRKEREKLRALARRFQYIELSGNEAFMDHYVDAMSF